MFEPQHLLDLQDSHGVTAAGSTDPNSWLSGRHHTTAAMASSSPTSLRRTLSSLSNAAAAASASSGNFDPVLFNDLVQMVPLVQSLIDRKATSSFTRRGSMIYTKTPSTESLARKTTELKARNGAQSIPTKRNKDHKINQDGSVDNFSMLSSMPLPTEKDMEELMVLREQVVDLQRKLSEKDELLKSAEISKSEMALIQAKLNEMKTEAAEKDSLLKSTQAQLADTKINLADKQAAVEKLQWEAMNSNQSVEKLQKDLQMVEGEISSFMLLVEGLARKTSTLTAEDYDAAVSCASDPNPDLDDLNEMEIQKLDAAREAYATAVAAAKEKQDDESIAAAACARMHLQSFVMRTNSLNGGKGSPTDGISRIVAETVSHSLV
ncbi:hypothetical protein ACH5RR_025126 [Cinchona calisaya]|uniref:Protein MICROTUBULE BINDING PROTEIN 2C n=1 Tax=Cinchona calisaya TaxID=153742 RepID=A0ABD2Z194_9GENT